MTENRFRKVQGFMYDKEGNNDKLLDFTEIEDMLNKLDKENKQLKKALWCIRKRYGYTIEEFIEDLKDNGTDLTKVDLE